MSLLLFDAGLGTRTDELRALNRKFRLMLTGLAANILFPVFFLPVLAPALMSVWHNPLEAQAIVVGLSLVAAMPVAGSSVTWIQSVNGGLGLGSALVLASTLLSPWSAPWALHAVGFVLSGDDAAPFEHLAAASMSVFLSVFVVGPTVVGMIARLLIGEPRVFVWRRCRRILRTTLLALLLYVNAAQSLPEAFRHPDIDFLAVMVGISLTLSLAAAAVGKLIAVLGAATRPEATTLMLTLAMTNNGTGLTLAGAILPSSASLVLLPLLCHNLIQHLVAAGISPVHRVDTSATRGTGSC